MSAPSVTPGQPSSGQRPPGFSSPSHHPGFRDLLKMAKGLLLACGVVATLLVGIAIGNSARKRIDRMSHGS
jgi:hypothetical protein